MLKRSITAMNAPPTINKPIDAQAKEEATRIWRKYKLKPDDLIN